MKIKLTIIIFAIINKRDKFERKYYLNLLISPSEIAICYKIRIRIQHSWLDEVNLEKEVLVIHIKSVMMDYWSQMPNYSKNISSANFQDCCLSSMRVLSFLKSSLKSILSCHIICGESNLPSLYHERTHGSWRPEVFMISETSRREDLKYDTKIES